MNTLELMATENFNKCFKYYGYEEFLRKVLHKCAFKKEHELTGKITMIDAEPSKRIYFVNEQGEEFTIRYFIERCGKKEWKASYTLYKTVWEEDGSGHGQEISWGNAVSRYVSQ